MGTKVYKVTYEFLYDLHDELMAYSAWSSHAYSFEYLRDEYIALKEFAEEHSIDVTEFVNSYEAVKAEYDNVYGNKELNITRIGDEDRIELLDKEFINNVAHMAQVAVNEIGIDDDWLRFE